MTRWRAAVKQDLPVGEQHAVVLGVSGGCYKLSNLPEPQGLQHAFKDALANTGAALRLQKDLWCSVNTSHVADACIHSSLSRVTTFLTSGLLEVLVDRAVRRPRGQLLDACGGCSRLGAHI